jgi:hypothetical protein
VSEHHRQLQEATQKIKDDVSGKLLLLSKIIVGTTSVLPQLPQTLISRTSKDILIEFYHSLISTGTAEDAEKLVEAKHKLLHDYALGNNDTEAIEQVLAVLFKSANRNLESEHVEQDPAGVSVSSTDYVVNQTRLTGPISFMTASPLIEEAEASAAKAMQNDSAIIMARVQSDEMEMDEKSNGAGSQAPKHDTTARSSFDKNIRGSVRGRGFRGNGRGGRRPTRGAPARGQSRP